MSVVRLRVRFHSECEDTFWSLAAHLDDAAFFLAFTLLIGGVVLLMSYH
jgi:hypothetical protein